MNDQVKKALPWQRHWLGVLLIAAVLVAVPFIAALGGQAWVRIANFAILYIFLALGLNIVVGYAGLLDLGYVAFYAVGAYVYALLASPHFGLHLPFWVILPLGAAIACMFGMLLGAPTLKLRGDYLAIVTLGFGEIIRIFLNNLNAPINVTNGAQGITLIDPIRIGDFSFAETSVIFGVELSGPQKYYFLLVALAILVIMVNVRLQDSRIGRAWQAIREDEVAAKACGINTRNIKLLAFAMGASFGGVAGGVFSAMQGFVSPESFLADGVDHHSGDGRSRWHGAHTRSHSRRHPADRASRGLALRHRAAARCAIFGRMHCRSGKLADAHLRLGDGAGHALSAGWPVAVVATPPRAC
jgi:branched-chain amino acid transport system permease protein